MSEFELHPIAVVRNARLVPEDDDWGGVVSEIVLEPSLPEESLDGIEAFSHIEIVFLFHLVKAEQIVSSARRPRDNPAWPRVGIFAQRGRVRPNRLGVSVSKLLGREGRVLTVQGLDAVDGTPVLDIKPVLAEFLPREPVLQPEWSHEIMENYWSRKK